MAGILYIIPYLSIGGTEKHLLSLVKGFNNEHRLFLLAPPGESLDLFLAEGISHYPFPRFEQHPSGIPAFIRGLKQIIKEHNIDLIHIHAANELVFLTGLLQREKPIVFTVHGFHGALKGWDYWVCARVSNSFADRVIAVAEAEEKILLGKGIRKDLIRTIYNGIPDPLPLIGEESPVPVSGGEKIIGTIARLEETKGINYLLEAFAILNRKISGLSLVIVGTGSKEEELKEQSRRLRIEDKVIFTGYRRDVHNYINCFDVMVIPSLHEAHPLVLLEGIGHGKPVVGSAVGGIPEVINHGENGFLVPPADAPKLAENIAELLCNPALWQTMAANARRSFEQRFSTERMVVETGKVYEDLLR
ncbi:MAG: glycosyltransferase family 4 protein [Firmicutes bacterium]|nr:glycosyltransferase family 4 protein [Bacillota bacterium]